jgi:hypothetical protein
VERGQNLATLQTGLRVTLRVGVVICGENGSGTVLIRSKLTGDGTVPDLIPTGKPKPVTQTCALVIMSCSIICNTNSFPGNNVE